jgi:hypothetical protein
MDPTDPDLNVDLKNDINIRSTSSKRNHLKKLVIFCWHLEGHLRKELGTDPDPYPDPYIRGMDLEQCLKKDLYLLLALLF